MSNWTTVITFVYQHEAHLAKNALEAEGIPVFIQDELTTQVYFSAVVGGVKLQVPEEEVERALTILKEGGFINEPTQTLEVVQTFSKEYSSVCPYCHSEDVAKNRKPGYAFIFSFLFFSIPFPSFRGSYHCFDCGKKWKVK